MCTTTGDRPLVSEQLVSVIVPIYKVEKTLNRCLASVAGQTHEELQIVCIDDGSMDSSGEICDEWASRDARFEVIHEQNAGVSTARNVGLSRAKGAWIAFVDADDYVEPTLIEVLLKACLSNGANISWCPAIDEDSRGTPIAAGGGAPHRRIGIVEHYSWFEPSVSHCVVWGALFRRSILEGISFATDLRVGEDTLFFAMALERADRLCQVAEPMYHYVYLEQSAAHGSFSARKADELTAWERVCRISGYPGAQAAYAQRCMGLCTRYWSDALFKNDYRQEALERYRANVAAYLRYLASTKRWRGLAGAILFFVCPGLYVQLKGAKVNG